VTRAEIEARNYDLNERETGFLPETRFRLYVIPTCALTQDQRQVDPEA
jgi:hypothetical protein